MKKIMFPLCGLIVLIGLLLSFQIFRAKKNTGPAQAQTRQTPLTPKQRLENSLSDLNLKLEQKEATLLNAKLKLGNLEQQKERTKFTPEGLKKHKTNIQETKMEITELEILVRGLKLSINIIKGTKESLKE